MANKINIVMFNMSTWHDWQNGVTNRNRHLLETLAEDDRVNQIIAVDFLPFNWKLKIKYWWRNIFLNHDPNQIIYGDGNSLCHQVKAKIFVYSTINTNKERLKYELSKIIEKLDWEDFVIYSGNPFIGNVKKFFPDDHCFIFDAIDNWMEHGSYVNYRNLLSRGYQEIDQSADLIFTVAKGSRNIFKNNSHVYHLPNGVDSDFFAEKNFSEAKKKTVTERLINLKIQRFFPELDKYQAIVGYLGVIESRLDINLLEFAIKRHPDKIFLFYGQTWPVFLRQWRRKSPIVRSLEKYPNVYFNHEYLPYERLPEFYNLLDLAIIPSRINNFTASMNPMKLYEYLACGLPVVSTNVAGVDDFKSVVYIAKNEKDFSRLIDKAINEDSEELRKKRVAMVKDYSWQSRVDFIVKMLNS